MIAEAVRVGEGMHDVVRGQLFFSRSCQYKSKNPLYEETKCRLQRAQNGKHYKIYICHDIYLFMIATVNHG